MPDDLQGSPLPTDRALGVRWDSEKDKILFQLQLSEKTACLRWSAFTIHWVRRTVATAGQDSAAGPD
ncbi:unnamed protein product [Echinostoma caproni]|uniref:Uncharacterized protein n=1 Tax=Echinostoma caproni TaxID=27848 RepID=A0A183A4B5_9TREM|nr:unnamed protein product [Echinostoma caproni]